MIIYFDYTVQFVGFFVTVGGALALTAWILMYLLFFIGDTFRKIKWFGEVWILGLRAKREQIEKKRNFYPG